MGINAVRFMLSCGYVATSGKHREKSSVLGQRLKADRELNDQTSGGRVFLIRNLKDVRGTKIDNAQCH